MKALGDTLENRVKNTLAAGMDLTMLCNGSFAERELALSVTPVLTADAARRLAEAEKPRTAFLKADNDNRADVENKLTKMIKQWKP